jgi:hypothetical protein
MPTFLVKVERTVHHVTSIEVEAKDDIEASDKAEDIAGGWSTCTSHFTDCTCPIVTWEDGDENEVAVVGCDVILKEASGE